MSTYARKMANEYCRLAGVAPGTSGYLALLELAEKVIERCAKEAETAERYSLGRAIAARIRSLATDPIP